MSYLVLARKARPQRFAEVIGQKPVVRTLENALTQNRVAHAIIFSGVRGTGKTTLARIMAKALNCTGRESAEPCNECLSCREINAGASVDLHEVDGASNRGIQEIRELKERIRFQPSSSRYKIFIIDEVHMLTTEAFNALLKTLEEPPEHVYFMFATTELHKVPLTILSRCQRFELKRLNRQELHSHFAGLASQEGVDISPAALDMVAREAAGSVRDGLSLLDQLFSYCGQTVGEEDVLDVLGLVSRHSVAELGTALLRADLARALEILDTLHDQGVNLKRLGNDLLQWLRELLLCKLGPNTAAMLGLPADELAAMQELAAPYSQEQLSALFNLLMDALEQSNLGRQPRLALEMAFIRAVQVADITPTAELISRFNAVLGDTPLASRERQSARTRQSPLPAEKKNVSLKEAGQEAEAQTAAPLPSEDTVPAPPTGSRPPNAQPVGEPATPPFPAESAQQAPAAEEHKTPEAAPETASPATPSSAANPPPAKLPASKTEAKASIEQRVKRDWDIFAGHVEDHLKWMGLSLQRALSVRVDNGHLSILFRDASDCIMLKQQEHLRKLTEFVLDFFQQPLEVRIEEEESRSCEINPLTGRTPLEERKLLASDPIVLTALEVFNGQLGDIRIGERYKAKAAEVIGEEEDPPLQEDEDD